MSDEVFLTVFPLWLRAFAFTLAVEVPIFAWIGKREFPATSLPRLSAAGAAGTCITHPLFWFAWSLVVPDYTWYMISGELLVALFETGTFALLARVPFPTAFIASFAANAASWAAGALLSAI